MEKKEKLFEAICKALIGYEKDGLEIINIQSQPEIVTHIPANKDDSYMESWERITINICVRGKQAEEDNNGYNVSNYRVENAKFDLTYDPNEGAFIADVNEILSVSKY